MKFSWFLPLVVLALAGCQKPPPAPPVPQEPSAKPAAAPVSQQPATKPVAGTVPQKPATKVSYAGTWAVADDQGQLFDIVVFPNGQAASNWTKGPSGAHGERGFWRLENNRLLVF
ncbi:MAG: hypothetical protein WCH98_20710, partial [Verrucomicrobiota bacterium]